MAHCQVSFSMQRTNLVPNPPGNSGLRLQARIADFYNKGQLNFSKILSPESSSHIPTLDPSANLFLASATKLITSIAAMQLVERGQVTLDEDITSRIPALASQQVLNGFSSASDSSPDKQEPVLEPRKNPITLRQLLTHSAGTAYDFLSPDKIQRWQALQGKTPISGANVEERFSYPLLYQPGTSWAYSTSIDWAGRVIESVTGHDLETYFRQNIFEPLGLTSLTFSGDRVAESGNLWPMSGRDPVTGKVIPFTGVDLNRGVTSPIGGQGLYGRMDEYMQILHSILIDDEKLLRPETAAEMFKPQLGQAPKKTFLRTMEDPSWAVGDFPDTQEYDWSFGGLLVDGDSHPYRKRGTLIWGGAANIFWVILPPFLSVIP